MQSQKLLSKLLFRSVRFFFIKARIISLNPVCLQGIPLAGATEMNITVGMNRIILMSLTIVGRIPSHCRRISSESARRQRHGNYIHHLRALTQKHTNTHIYANGVQILTRDDTMLLILTASISLKTLSFGVTTTTIVHRLDSNVVFGTVKPSEMIYRIIINFD